MFVGSGAPQGQGARHPRPLRRRDQIHIGIEWLESIHFGHIDTVGKRVLIIGVGNTAMDCCRTSAKRLGGTDVQGHRAASRASTSRRRRGSSRTPRRRGVEIVENHAPKRFVVENGKLVGMEFERLRWSEDERQAEERSDRHASSSRATTSSSPSARTTRSRGSSATSASSSTSADMPVVDKTTFMSTRAGRVLRRRRGVGPGEHHLGGRARASGGDLDSQPLPGHCRRPSVRRTGMNLVSTKMGMHAWATATTTTRRSAHEDEARRARRSASRS